MKPLLVIILIDEEDPYNLVDSLYDAFDEFSFCPFLAFYGFWSQEKRDDFRSRINENISAQPGADPRWKGIAPQTIFFNRKMLKTYAMHRALQSIHSDWVLVLDGPEFTFDAFEVGEFMQENDEESFKETRLVGSYIGRDSFLIRRPTLEFAVKEAMVQIEAKFQSDPKSEDLATFTGCMARHREAFEYVMRNEELLTAPEEAQDAEPTQPESTG